MKKLITISIECGEKTCASYPGKFCKYVGTTNFGTNYVCKLFITDSNSHTFLKEEDGWLQRCYDCIEQAQPTYELNEAELEK